ncbi:hypothetical protein [Nonomuraea sp. NPDC050310]|uniref:hypothetical protein n=1 Tax=Nonomuraea sp. NPDC050310 TaxID=3154935 RepID=UPI0033D182D6
MPASRLITRESYESGSGGVAARCANNPADNSMALIAFSLRIFASTVLSAATRVSTRATVTASSRAAIR